jgi:quercetin dioxygenase-like cupin family protein
MASKMEDLVRHQNSDFRWEGVEVHPYKEDGGTHFKSITRQTLFRGSDDLGVEFRYFEIQADGHSTLERHEHTHVVMVIRGSGEVLVGDALTKIGLRDVVHIPPMTWHQFRANQGEELGFLCVVSVERDRPQRPDASLVKELSVTDEIAEFVRV